MGKFYIAIVNPNYDGGFRITKSEVCETKSTFLNREIYESLKNSLSLCLPENAVLVEGTIFLSDIRPHLPKAMHCYKEDGVIYLSFCNDRGEEHRYAHIISKLKTKYIMKEVSWDSLKGKLGTAYAIIGRKCS